MKFTDLGHKAVSLIVLIAFIALLQGGPAPAQTTAAPGESRAKVTTGDDTPGSFEVEAEAPAAIKKHKKFPWLMAALGAVAVGVTIYLLVHKKKTKYTLWANLDQGVTGSPQGQESYKNGQNVPYSYKARQGYFNLKVMLDGVEKPASGTIVMDRDHVIFVSAEIEVTEGVATLQINSTPAGAEIYIDSLDTGFVTPHTFSFTDSSSKSIMLRQCGYWKYYEDVDIAFNRTITVNPELYPGINEPFDTPLLPCWLARDPSGMTITPVFGSGMLTAVAPARGYQYALYQRPFQAPYTFSTRGRIASSIPSKSDYRMGVVLSTSSDMTKSRGYEFIFDGKGRYAIYRNDGYNYHLGSGQRSTIMPPTPCEFCDYSGAWKQFKIANNGSGIKFWVNDVLIFYFINTTYDMRYAALAVYGKGAKAEFTWANMLCAVLAGLSQ
jgi:hypothetical protein